MSVAKRVQGKAGSHPRPDSTDPSGQAPTVRFCAKLGRRLQTRGTLG
jgi:hypothetical protein